jgi:hypothetical protein
VQALLDRLPAWRGWHTKVVSPVSEGPCGTVSQLTGTDSRGVDGMFDTAHRLVLITHTGR